MSYIIVEFLVETHFSLEGLSYWKCYQRDYQQIQIKSGLLSLNLLKEIDLLPKSAFFVVAGDGIKEAIATFEK